MTDFTELKQLLSAFETKICSKFIDIDNKIRVLNDAIDNINTKADVHSPNTNVSEEYFKDAAEQLGKGWGYIEDEYDDAEIFKAYPMLKNEYLAPEMSDAEIAAQDRKEIDEYLQKHQDFDFSYLQNDIPLSKYQLSS